MHNDFIFEQNVEECLYLLKDEPTILHFSLWDYLFMDVGSSEKRLTIIS